MKSFAAFTLILIFLVGCGGVGGGPATTRQYVVHSTPSFCANWTEALYFCANVAETNDYVIRTTGLCDAGFSPEWGITYVVTVSERKLSSDFVADGCDYERTLISIDGETADPLGTRYKNGTSSIQGGLKISRINTGESWFRLRGYAKPIYCAESLCSEISTGAPQNLPSGTFELVEIDGSREIALVSGDN